MLKRSFVRCTCLASTLIGCASAPTGPGERGLADLREALVLAPVAGQVERRGGRLELVFAETGTVVAAVPVVDAGGKCARSSDPRALMFEGDPGAALTFGRGTAIVWQSHPTQDCAVANEVFAIQEPAWVTLVEMPASASTAQTSLTVPADAEPVTVALTASGARVSHGAEVLDLTFPSESRCALSARVERVDRGGGVTWLRIAYTMDQNFDYESCEEALEYAISDTQATGETWIEVADNGGLRMRARSDEPAWRAEGSGDRWHVFDVAGGVIEYAEVSQHQIVREGPELTYSWTWTLVIGASRVVLAEGAQ